MHNIHCGACNREFETTQELQDHLDTCPAARVKLKMLHRNICMGDETGHPLGSLIYCTYKFSHLIDQYCYAIVYDIPTHERTKYHRELCENLGIEYKKFRPFEDESITKIPETLDEALEIFWNGIEKYVNEVILVEHNTSNTKTSTTRKMLTLKYFKGEQC